MERREPGSGPRYEVIANSLRAKIAAGAVAGEKLPSDQDLSLEFHTSRLTIIRAVRLLVAEGLITRRAGSGSYVNGSAAGEKSHNFGLLIPDLGSSEIFEPICQGMARAGQSAHQALLWGNTSEGANTKAKQTQELCRYFISRRVSGVFFAPIEFTESQREINSDVVERLTHAKIPIVFLDRGTAPFPMPNVHDLVGIDNWREGARMADHLLSLGCKRLGFVVRPESAPTVDARLAGLNQALWNRGIALQPDWVFRSHPTEINAVRDWYHKIKPDGILCANDFTAANLMQTLLALGIGIPEQVRIVGIDDVKYAALLPIPLTTLRQPCNEIGSVAIITMLERLKQPSLAPRTISLACEIVVRKSCGS